MNIKQTSHQEELLKQLMHQSMQGDNKAYHQLLQKITPLARQYIRKKINNPTDVEDVAQNILIAIHKSRQTFEEKQKFLPWFYAICHYKITDHLRDVYRHNNNTSLEEEKTEPALYEEKDVTLIIEQNEYLHKALKMLSAKSRLILVLSKGAGLTSREIATKMNMTESAVKVSIHRALKQLQKRGNNAK